MKDEIYRIAVERARTIRAELQRLEVFISTYEELSAGKSHTEEAHSQTSQHDRAEPASAVKETYPTRGVPQEQLERVVADILLQNGAPLQRQPLFERVKATGIAIGGRDERGNFGSKISRSERFINLPKLGYWPKDKPCISARYTPENAP